MITKLKVVLFVITILLLHNNIFCRDFNNKISGKVIDNETGEPVLNAQVYISGTTIGTTTGIKGEYSIKNIPPGIHELVVSMIGYETKIKTIVTREGKNMEVDFVLSYKPIEIDEVVVESERPDNWEKNLKIFKEKFLGTTLFAQECEIENELYLDFNEDVEGQLRVKADRTLIINNHSLGYKIYCDIIAFIYYKQYTETKYTIMTRYTDMQTEDPEKKKLWMKNRESAFLGSIHHFLKSLKDDSYKDKGYLVYHAKPANQMHNASKIDWLVGEVDEDEKIVNDGFLYGEHTLNFEDFLLVWYDHPNIGQTQESYFMLNYYEVNLDEFGYSYEIMPFKKSGYWATTGMADMLPKYYGEFN